MEITLAEKKKEKKMIKKHEDSLRDHIKHINISHYRGPRRRRKKRAEAIFKKTIGEKFPYLGKERDT